MVEGASPMSQHEIDELLKNPEHSVGDEKNVEEKV